MLRKNKHFFGAKDVTLEKVTIPIIPIAVGRAAVREQRARPDAAPDRRPQAVPVRSRDREGSVPLPRIPGTWYLLPQVTKPPFDNLKVRRRVAHAIDRENVVKVAQGFAIPAHAMIPPGFPGALDDKKTSDLQRFDPKLAMAMLKGTPFEGGKNWPKITLTMRDEALAPSRWPRPCSPCSSST